MHIFLAYLHSTSSLPTYSAHLPCLPTQHIFPAYLHCTSSLPTYTAHFPCLPTLHIFPAYLHCTFSLPTYTAHLPCLPTLHIFPAYLHCTSSFLSDNRHSKGTENDSQNTRLKGVGKTRGVTKDGGEMNGNNTFVHYFLNLTSVSRLRIGGSSTLFPRCVFVAYSGSGNLQGN